MEYCLSSNIFYCVFYFVRSQTKVFISAKPNPSNSLTHLPWVGTIYLNCDGVQQVLKKEIIIRFWEPAHLPLP